MHNVEDLRKKCEILYQERREDVKLIFTDWLQSIIKRNLRWRAIQGNRRCKPIPINKDFYNTKIRSPYSTIREKEAIKYYWPELPDKEIIETIESLGFIVWGNSVSKMGITVPAYKKGEELTFAQAWVKRINHNFSVYVQEKKLEAKYHYDYLIDLLCNTDSITIKTCNGYTLFEGFKYEPEISSRCSYLLNAMLKNAGIERYYEEGKYGIKVLH